MSVSGADFCCRCIDGLSFQRTKRRGLNPTTRPVRPDGSTDLESRSTTSFLCRICLTNRQGAKHVWAAEKSVRRKLFSASTCDTDARKARLPYVVLSFATRRLEQLEEKRLAESPRKLARQKHGRPAGAREVDSRVKSRTEVGPREAVTNNDNLWAAVLRQLCARQLSSAARLCHAHRSLVACASCWSATSFRCLVQA